MPQEQSLAQRPPPRGSDEVRQAFLEFFKQRGHLERPSSSLVPPSSDPTVLLTTAGMQQMIPFMLGRAAPPASRMVSVQKCFRTTDIDAVGNPRNLTFFEMLGNFSIGDYFKPEAIAWAWTFVTEWLQLPTERVWITVHPTDDEALQLWLGLGIPRDKIVALEDNWWGPPGAEGPCGPDSELYFDRGPEHGCERSDCAPGCECDRYLEFWNLVFMQFFQDRDGQRTPLPRPNIDTGMGLERTSALMQGVFSVYETDLFRPIIDEVAGLAGLAFGQDERRDYALRVVADHGRAMTFLAGDGVSPGNDGRGYVMRRIVRRAVRYGRALSIDRPFLSRVVERVIERMANHYPQLRAQRESIVGIVELEEQRFRETLAAGESRLEEWVEQARAAGAEQVDGRLLFLLHDSYGFPFELSEETLAEHGLSADRAGFEAAMAEQRERSRRRTAFAGQVSQGGLDAALPPTEFLGYESVGADAELIALQADHERRAELAEGARGVLILNRTPFYPEGGGQVGDRGVIRLADGLFEVEDTQDDAAGRILHRGRLVRGQARLGEIARAEVDRGLRSETTRHHTLTHILHQSLRDLLGPATQQRGSLVAPGVARFDFNAPRPLAQEQRARLQELINERILGDHQVKWQVMPLEEARQTGALMIFGEKYGDQVRLVDIGGFSRELCGGTHVHHSSEVGTAVLLRETGVGSGLRRIEIVAGEAGLQHIRRRLEDVQTIAARLGVPPDEALRKIDELLEQLDEARREMQRLVQQKAAQDAVRLTEQASVVPMVDDVKVLATRVQNDSPVALVQQWDALRAQQKATVVFLGASGGPTERVDLLVGVTEDLRPRGLNAGALMRRFAELAGGKGGGSPTLAKGSAGNAERLEAALQQAPRLVREALQGS
jgi:alanyl-tRNA synthetase